MSLAILDRFRTCFPEYDDKTTSSYTAQSPHWVDEEPDRYADRQGLFVLAHR